MSTRCVVIVDADNTLWDTDQVYAEAQLALLHHVEENVGQHAPQSQRLTYVRTVDQALAEKHHAGLRYPPRLLAKAIALTLRGYEPSAAVRMAWSGGKELTAITDNEAEQIEQEFLKNIKQIPKLRKGVRVGLDVLRNVGCRIIVLTEGHRQNSVQNIRHHGLDSRFDRIIEARKNQRLFERIRTGTGYPPVSFMIGDQLDRDIEPAKRAGFKTVFFPGGFRPKWHPQESEVGPDHIVNSFEEAARIVESAERLCEIHRLS